MSCDVVFHENVFPFGVENHDLALDCVFNMNGKEDDNVRGNEDGGCRI